ncbi:sialate O-acetylesterase [Methylovulum psychrotolerans]|uniref:Acetyl xylan esterase n=1 Tax=Methylovulum psychrotolerans TaxID=1704499 RepID=A0A2S5CRM1_9GAMM|nr:sialate O-acetylesterase [Methylovulum psychrotolerans]POZ53455.1 acetyl xylan esterase [Methylovulum psychrotolerans]
MMKAIVMGSMLFWGGVSMANQSLHKNRLFILSGQSNMARLNPDDTFTPTLQKAFPNDHVVVIKDAQGGQPISRWTKPSASSEGNLQSKVGDLYDRLLSTVKVSSADGHFDTVTFVWMQGESDANKRQGEQYESKLRAVIGQLKQDMQRDDLYVIVGRISDFGFKRQDKKSDWEKVRNAQVHIAETDNHATWVDTDDLNGGMDRLHYTDEGYKTLGERFAQAAITLIKKNGS